jgi:hypothetical protein
MSYHVINYRLFKLAKKDEEFQAALIATGQKFPRFCFDELEKGVWAAGYAGWVMGKRGPEVYLKMRAEVI